MQEDQNYPGCGLVTLEELIVAGGYDRTSAEIFNLRHKSGGIFVIAHSNIPILFFTFIRQYRAPKN